jgi:choice-of-anchor A domain-containing protein/uncharacterized repeat protein (TIGR01451 family)
VSVQAAKPLQSPIVRMLVAFLVFAVAVLAVRAAPGQASARQTCGSDVLGTAQGYNLFVQHDYGATSTSVEGSVAAGGNVTINSYSVGGGLTASSSRVDLIAGGNLTSGGGGASAANGSVTYAGTLQGTISTPYGTLTQASPPFDFGSQFSSLRTTSTTLGGLTPNGSAAGPSYAFELTGTSTTTNVFTIEASVLQQAQVIKIHVPLGSSTLVNVTGDSYSSARFPTAAIQFWDGSTYVQPGRQTSSEAATLRSNLLWNFPTATNVQIGPSIGWQGSILAPRAAVSFQSSTDLFGSLIAESLANGNGSAWNVSYTGCIALPPAAPVAVDDSYAVGQGTRLTVAAPGVLGNDTGPSGVTLTAKVVDGPSHGRVDLSADGSFSYTPASATFNGTDTFTYRASAGGVESNVATVTITVNVVAPVAQKLVTFVARSCPDYADVTANLARNNIQESLRDLGADTLYTAGQPIDPDIEARGQPTCTPISNWQFTLGTGYESRAVTGRWGALSIVTNPFSTSIVTKDETPLLNDQGLNTGKEIAGAVTIRLTDAQADLAAHSSSLWVQGGTTTDPVLDKIFPDLYGFAALRCAIDNLNGDNVEWVAYPAGASHVFCYAYYVTPPIPSGTIIVRKEVTSPAGATQTFPFKGNISFEPDQSFELAVKNGAAASMTFSRAAVSPGGEPWRFAEVVPPGWQLTKIDCSSADGGSKVTTDLASASTAVELGPGDTVTCTYADAQKPPPDGTLELSKTSLGGVGTFGYTITPAGGGKVVTATATTSTPGIEVAAKPDSIPLAPGRYKIDESLPESARGTWSVTGVTCNGHDQPLTLPVTVTISAAAGVACGFENTFEAVGSITIHKIAFGKTGTAGFAVYPKDDDSGVVYSQTATVDTPGVSVLANGDDTSTLPLGAYTIQELESPTGAGWVLSSVSCNGQVVGVSQGAVDVTLTASDPDVDCVFTNTYTAPSPGPSPSPEPEPTPPVPPDPIPTADVQVTKTADLQKVEVGQVVTYTIKVANTGDVAETEVVVAEQTPIATATIVSLVPEQGTCQTANYPPSCDLGTVDAGHTVTIIAKLRATKPGPLPNSVAVSSATVVEHPPTAEVEGEVETHKPETGGSASGKPPHHPSPPTTPKTPPPLTG